MLRRAAGKGVFVPGSHIERDPEAPGIMNGPTGTKRSGTLSNSSAIWI